MSWSRDVGPSERARLMSAHMMPIERQASEATVEILASPHIEAGNECSIEVTHRADGCVNFAVPVCAALVAFKSAFAAAGGVCNGCLGLARDCWNYWPI